MEKLEVEVLKEFLSMNLNDASEVFNKFKAIPNAELYQGEHRGERFLFIKGTKEIDKLTLVAHADTVHSGEQKILSGTVNGIEYLFGKNRKVGIGADDRAGCAILWLLVNSGHNILVMDGEEIGLRGARFLMNNYPEIVEEINKSKYVLEFDRLSNSDYKFYTVPVSYEFERYIKENTRYSDKLPGIYTDICELCQDVCGVNISVGYYNAHTPMEYINVNEWLQCLQIAKRLASQENIPDFSLDKAQFDGRMK